MLYIVPTQSSNITALAFLLEEHLKKRTFQYSISSDGVVQPLFYKKAHKNSKMITFTIPDDLHTNTYLYAVALLGSCTTHTVGS